MPLIQHLFSSQHSTVYITRTMSNAKYSPAPTRDSLDEPEQQYTQAPPSYQDAPAAGPSATTGYGTPREEDDNVPDDFKVSHR